MTIWTPDLSQRSGPKYRAIAQAIAEDITEGRLAAGDRLPPQRDLAWALKVTVGTVSRAYAEAERTGLVRGEVGRGTYVLPPRHREETGTESDRGQPIGLNFALAPPGAEEAYLAETLRTIAANRNSSALLNYQPSAGTLRHREAGAKWLARTGVDVPPDRVVLSAGAQHAIMIALSALTSPGDRIATECLTYPGVKSVAAMLGLQLQGLAMDGDGLIPDAFEAACRSDGVKVLYCIPTGQNPTTAVMPPNRRARIAEIAERYGVTIVEDDILAGLYDDPPAPIASLAPDRCCYLTSLSKTLAAGLRLGFVAGPPSLTERLTAAVRATCWNAPPLSAEVAALWIESDTADEIIASRKREAAARLAVANEILPPECCDIRQGQLNLWLKLPEPWRANDFVAEAQSRGATVTAAEEFAVGRGIPPHAVRICFGMPRSRSSMERGLKILAEVLCGPACSAPRIV